jgi:farnesyl-diphosphate farnesyltransferase
LQETVAAAYLSSRALDEIEDNNKLSNASKEKLLHEISWGLQTRTGTDLGTYFSVILRPYQTEIPEVSLRIGEWLSYPPEDIAPRIWYTVATMAGRMAYWVERNWEIRTEADLNGYTFDVAGAAGLLLCDLWSWFAGTQIDRAVAVQFGRGLQAVNILRNRAEDLQRQVDFYPLGWKQEHMLSYAHNSLNPAREKVNAIPRDAFTYLFEIPLLLAEATLDAVKNGKTKLTRREVKQITDVRAEARQKAEVTQPTGPNQRACTSQDQVGQNVCLS